MPPIRTLTLGDVRYARDACSRLPGPQRRACYEAFGVDGAAAENYLDDVERLERTFHISAALLCFGAMMGWVQRFCQTLRFWWAAVVFFK